MKNKIIHSALFGLAVGDALGVPVEFESRGSLQFNPVKEMLGYGTHGQPAGTWSDDSSLTFCLAESLCNGYNLKDISQKFVKWYDDKVWTPHGKVFDIGIATGRAIREIKKGIEPVLCGGYREIDNGNGSLMRILPLVFHLKKEESLPSIFEKVKDVSSITHGHFRSIFACFIYLMYALEITRGASKQVAYLTIQIKLKQFIVNSDFDADEIKLFERVIENDISKFSVDEIYSSGYVIHTLEASLWCILNNSTYRETVLSAVNLGEDTDTTAAVAGGIAGLIYGFESIPCDWIKSLSRVQDIEKLCNELSEKYE